METPATTQILTYADYLELPETTQPYSIVDGEMIMSPAPTSDHQWISFNSAEALRAYVRTNKSGVVLFSPIDVLIRRDPLRTRQPDILYLNSERTGIRGRAQLRKMPIIKVAPDLVVEIYSPSETRTDIEEKLRDFQSLGVLEAWVVSPEAQTVEVLRLHTSPMETSGLFGMGQSIKSGVLPGIELTVDAIFE